MTRSEAIEAFYAEHAHGLIRMVAARVGHPPTARRQSVYQLAHRRLRSDHGGEPPARRP